MAGELVISDRNWLDVRNSASSVPMPFSHEVFLKECHVAGTMHVDDVLYKTKSVDVGAQLVLKREPANGYDELAIRVETAAGERIGWVPKKHNDVLARLMDAGKMLAAKIKEIEKKGSFTKIAIGIYLVDF
jgi:hypothetical protein